jgi:hypothetical protein
MNLPLRNEIAFLLPRPYCLTIAAVVAFKFLAASFLSLTNQPVTP